MGNRFGAARALCVDDEILIRMAIVDVCIDAGFEVADACNGQEAKKLLDASDYFDLLITDIRLGDIDGWEVASYARQLWPEIAVIYISGQPSPGAPLPNSRFLAKPFCFSGLKRMLQDLMARADVGRVRLSA